MWFERNGKRQARGGALYYAVFLSLMVSVVLGMILLAGMHQKRQMSEVIIETRLVENVESAINYGLSKPEVNFNGEKFELFEGDTVSIERKQWGCFFIYLVSAYENRVVRSKNYLVGMTSGEIQEFALFKLRKDQIVNVSGKTTIVGGINFPRKNLRSSAFEGRLGTERIDVYCVENKKVMTKDVLFGRLFNMYNSGLSSVKESFEPFVEEGNSLIIRSFKEEPLVLGSANNLNLNGESISGNVILFSADTIFVGKTSQLKDVCVYGNYIEIEDGFTGTAQFYAKKGIRIGRGCVLNYPSVVGVFKEENVAETGLFVGENSNIFGALWLTHMSNSHGKGSAGVVELHGSLRGLLMTDGILELKGHVCGTVICSDFIYRTAKGAYQNYIVDAMIHNLESMQLVPLPVIFESKRKLNVIDWVQ